MEERRATTSGAKVGDRSNERNSYWHRWREHPFRADEGWREIRLRRRSYKARVEEAGPDMPVPTLKQIRANRTKTFEKHRLMHFGCRFLPG